MSLIVLVSSQTASWEAFASELKKELGVEIETARSVSAAMDMAREKNPAAMIIDQPIDGKQVLPLVRELMTIDAMIHVACVSDLSKEAFHEAFEGLGVLMQLSSNKDLSEASQLAVCLRQVSDLAS